MPVTGIRVLLLVSVLLAACGPTRRDDERDPSPCDRPCAGGCCAKDEACIDDACVPCEPTTCAAEGVFCGDIPDTCGGTLRCGDCQGDQTCGGGGVPGRCGRNGCTGETDAELCATAGLDCGSLQATDSCGDARTIESCGSCTAPATCGGSGRNGICGQPGEQCVPETDRRFCQRLGRDCGSLVDFDNCDASRTVASCGSCDAPKSCGGGGRTGVCGCTGETDAQLCSAAGATCGTINVTDRCGIARHPSCGSCSAPQSCGGAGTPNRCGCTGETDTELCSAASANCGTIRPVDRCGRSRTITCGSCTSPLSCGGGGTANRCGCTGDTDASLCSRAGAQCGTVRVTDSCNTTRDVSCGSCTAPNTCGGGGTANRCGCTDSRTNTQLCTTQGYECGFAEIADRCGITRSISNCGNCTAPESCGTSWFDMNTCICDAETDTALCTQVGWQCGSPSLTDKCGNPRAPNCGTCNDPATCGTDHRCHCDAETNAQFCARLGKNCGSVTANDNCGTSRTVNCGTSCPSGQSCSSRNQCTAWTVVTNSVTSNDITGIWGVSPTEIYMTSDSENSANPRLVKWNGTSLTATAKLTATGFTLNGLIDVWANSGNVFAVGYGKDSAGAYKTVVLRSAGGSNWTTVTEFARFNGVAWNVRGTSANDLWVAMPGFATLGHPPLLQHFNGTTWAPVTMASNIEADEMLQGLMPFSPTDVFMTANSGDVLWRSNGTTMTSVPAPHSGYFDCWGSSPNDVWMSGSDGKIGHWNGSVVEDRSVPNSTAWFYDIHGTGPNDIWAVGTGTDIAHWDGTRWILEPSPTTRWLTGVWVTPTEVWAVGDSGTVLRRAR